MKLTSLRRLGFVALAGPVLMVLVSCSPAPPSGSAASGTRSGSSPAPVATPALSDYVTYTNTFDHYSVTYPADWFVDPSIGPGSAVSIRNKAYDFSHVVTAGLWKLDIIVEANPNGLTAREWADQSIADNSVRPSGCFAKVLAETAVSVGGEAGIERRVSECRGTGIGIYVAHNGRMILMDAFDQSDFQPMLASILASFAFTR